MASRKELDAELRTLLGSTNTFFQPPASIKMKYPAFVYSYDTPLVVNADNKIYNITDRYSVTYIDTKLDMDKIKSIIQHFPMCSLNRAPYAVNGLYHAVFTLYY